MTSPQERRPVASVYCYEGRKNTYVIRLNKSATTLIGGLKVYAREENSEIILEVPSEMYNGNTFQFKVRKGQSFSENTTTVITKNEGDLSGKYYIEKTGEGIFTLSHQENESSE